MSPARSRAAVALARFPRVSGDEPPHTQLETLTLMFSPRERG